MEGLALDEKIDHNPQIVGRNKTTPA